MEDSVGEEVKAFEKTEHHLDSKDLNENENTSKTKFNLDRQKDSMESDNEVFTQTSESETVKSNPGNSSNDTKSELGSVKTGQKTNPHSKPNAEPEVRIEKGDEEWEREKGQEL